VAHSQNGLFPVIDFFTTHGIAEARLGEELT
jgi:hypothetical protein